MVRHSNSVSAHVSSTGQTLALCGSGRLRLAGTRFTGTQAHGPLPPLLYAHGLGQTRHAWTRTAEALAAHGYTGVSYDARGHGDSQRNPDGMIYSGVQFADDLSHVARQQGQPPVLIGASMGGLFGLMAQARMPDLFQAMVLVDITPRWESAGLQRILGFMQAFPQGFASLQEASESIAAYLPHRRTRKAPEALRLLLRQDEAGRWHWHWDRRLIPELAHNSEQHQQTLAVAARAINCPILLISGGRSDLVSQQTVEEFKALVPHAQHVHLPDATHRVAGDDNHRFTATVLEYLGRWKSSLVSPAFSPIESPADGGSATGASP